MLGEGLIPARAGNTRRPSNYRHYRRAHPRSRGEHIASAAPRQAWQGSSPLARGTRWREKPQESARGLIPARAGNTRPDRDPRTRSWAHPRSRGEHESLSAIRAWLRGSSPLARGTPGNADYAIQGGGLIPARAGNTTCENLQLQLDWAHPRSRGEHLSRPYHGIGSRGSSPLARGTHAGAGFIEHARGLIPARAGNTVVGRG